LELVENLLKGDKRAAAKLISLVENEDEEASEVLRELYKHTGKTHIVGITGPPGVGKSSLVFGLTKVIRDKGKKVGIVAIDPTSRFTGGAILGDRIRMTELSTDEGVFMRSMGTRGHHGGIAKATTEAAMVLDAMGMDIVFVETVGAGQSQSMIWECVHTSILVEMPGMGDEIQALKAGILEIGDIFVVNKGDREGADQLVKELESVAEYKAMEQKWKPPVHVTVATEGQGLESVVDSIEGHLGYLKESGEYQKREEERAKGEFTRTVQDLLLRKAFAGEGSKKRFDELLREIMEKKTDPYSAAEQLLEE
jgi:LAO/AO transport system kinase